METAVYHVVPSLDHWAVKRQGHDNATRLLGTKEEAVWMARRLARQHTPSRVIQHRADGTIESQQSYEREKSDSTWSVGVPLGIGLVVGAAVAIGLGGWYLYEAREDAKWRANSWPLPGTDKRLPKPHLPKPHLPEALEHLPSPSEIVDKVKQKLRG